MSRLDVAGSAALSVAILRNAASVLAEAGPARFVAETPLAPGGTIGRHVRHIVEFYDNLLHGLEGARVDYARRVRDDRMETEIEVSAARIEAVIVKLHHAVNENPGRSLEVRTEPGDSWCVSTLERELQAVASHTVHHLALVAVILRAHGFEPPADFGVAASTLEYLARQAR